MIVEKFDFNVVWSVYCGRAYAQIADIKSLMSHITGQGVVLSNFDDLLQQAADIIEDKFPDLARIDQTYCNEYNSPEPILDKVFDILGQSVVIEGHGSFTTETAPVAPAVRYG